MQSLEGGRTYAETQDFTSYRQNSVAVQHGTSVLATPKGEEGVSISHLAWANGELSHDRPEIQVCRLLITCRRGSTRDLYMF
jgi:hypothetical protein